MTPEELQVIIDDILRLHHDGDTFTGIASKLQLSATTTQHVIEHGELPEREPQWKSID